VFNPLHGCDSFSPRDVSLGEALIPVYKHCLPCNKVIVSVIPCVWLPLRSNSSDPSARRTRPRRVPPFHRPRTTLASGMSGAPPNNCDVSGHVIPAAQGRGHHFFSVIIIASTITSSTETAAGGWWHGQS
jgi:hypothetical protein